MSNASEICLGCLELSLNRLDSESKERDYKRNGNKGAHYEKRELPRLIKQKSESY